MSPVVVSRPRATLSGALSGLGSESDNSSSGGVEDPPVYRRMRLILIGHEYV